MKCIKYLLFFMNLIFTVTGCLLVVAGMVIQAAYTQYLDFLGHQVLSTPGMLVLLGMVIAGVSFCGCCGAIRESHCMALTFSCLLAVIFILQLGTGVAAYNLRTQVGDLIGENMKAGMRNFMRSGYKGVTETWNVLQHELSCCGTSSYKDWANTTFSLSTSSVPDSCCVYDVVGCGRGILNLDITQASMKIHPHGCLAILSFHMMDNVATMVVLLVNVAIIQLVGLLLSFCLANSIKKECEIV